MKTPRISRRQFFKASAFGAGALALVPAIGLATVAATPSHEAQAAAEQPDGPAVPQPTFNPIASNTTFGPLTDVSMGWDGTVWGIDASGAPHVYDSINDAWLQQGDGIDAAASDNQVLYLFRGSQYVTFDLATRQTSAPADIAAAWPNLPDTFKLGVDGASYDLVTKKLYLFDGGRYAPADGSAPPKNLTDLANWPANDPAFGAGVIHGVFSALQSDGTTITFLLRGAQTLTVDLATETVTGAPQPFTNYYDYATYLPADFRINGLDAGVAVVSPAPAAFTNYMYRGAGLVTWSRGSPYPQVAQYIASAHPNWPATWHPVLLQAPSGRDGSLWSVVATAGYAAGTGQVIQHNGEAWAVPAAGTIATSVSAGQDGTVIHVQPNTGSMFKWTGSGWSALGSVPAQLQQVSLGGANDVWVRDTNNNVYRYDPTANTFTQSTTVGQAAHIATTGDGTLWHARANDANTYRLLTGQNLLQPAIPVQQGIVTSVRRVTGTGFGTAYCLAQAGAGVNLYRYDSPYVFKSQYGFAPIQSSTIVEALGAVYFTNQSNASGVNYPVVALDAHTGVMRSQSAGQPDPADPTIGYTAPAYDPVNELIYVGLTQPFNAGFTNRGPGRVIALDAHNLSTVVWSYATTGYVTSLTVNDGTLLVGDRSGNLYGFDTVATRANPARPTVTTFSVPFGMGIPINYAMWSLSEVAAANDSYFMAFWIINPPTNPNQQIPYFIQVDSGLQNVLVSYAFSLVNLTSSQLTGVTLAAPPRVIASDPSSGVTTLAINNVSSVDVVNFESVQQTVNPIGGYGLPSGRYVLGGLAQDAQNNQLWFGDNQATLYCLDAGPGTHLVNHTPVQIGSNTQAEIWSTPVVYRDASGDMTILVGLLDGQQAGNLYGFDPDTGNQASLPTANTQVTALSQGVSNGVIYAGGLSYTQGSNAGVSQLFGLRLDALIQAERDFIIESQLMQDPQDPGGTGGAAITTPDGNIIPPSVARYQTHITVVDDGKTPRINEPVKIWADTPGTVITIEGAQYTIGPGDADYTQTQTGPDGTVIITTDATDVNASALRAWASFMDPYERIVIYPDHEWHGRVTASYNDTNPNDPPDPTRPNLGTVYNYTGTPLFTQDEVTDQYPGDMATAIGQMQAGLNPGGANAATLAGSLKTLHASNSAAPYIAYSDLGGMHYAASNALVQRTATTVAPFGLMWDTDVNDRATLTILSHSDAADEIDAITGTPWNPNDPNFAAAQADGVLRVHSWGSFWHHVRDAVEKAGAKIKKVVMSAADKIKAAIAYVANGVTTFFKVVIEVVEDVVESIGAFFLKLGKLIENVIEALSLLFHFGEILDTQRWMVVQINSTIADAATQLQLPTSTNPVTGPLNDWFNEAQNDIVTTFNKVRQILGVSDDTQININGLNGGRTTAHTAFKASNGSAGPTSTGDSHAVPCTHAAHKFKSGLPSATTSWNGALMRNGARSAAGAGAGVLPTAVQTDIDEVVKFITGFVNSLESDSALKEAFDSLSSAIGQLVSPTSGGDFFKSSLNVLLSLIETLLVGTVAVGQAIVDGMLGVIGNLLSVISSVLNASLDIPFISWLFKLLTGEDLTILNALTLVAAIPVTFIYRVAAGHYPSQDGITTAAVARSGRIGQSLPNLSPEVQKQIVGTMSSTFMLGLTVSRSVVDVAGDDPPYAGTVCVLAFGVCYSIMSFPPLSTATPTSDQWMAWAVGLILSLLGTFKVIPATANLGLDPVLMALRVSLAIIRIMLYFYQILTTKNYNLMTDYGITRSMFQTLPPLFNWLKVSAIVDATDGISLAVLVLIDIVAGYVIIGLDLTLAWVPSDPEPLPRRLFFPWVTYNLPPTRAHPLAVRGAAP